MNVVDQVVAVRFHQVLQQEIRPVHAGVEVAVVLHQDGVLQVLHHGRAQVRRDHAEQQRKRQVGLLAVGVDAVGGIEEALVQAAREAAAFAAYCADSSFLPRTPAILAAICSWYR